ncbi:MAG: hypothetical protein DRN14_07935 [Thermoplasmata archaeon]|nr:MAG: hypothetical protein DRN14_07935 [Thermoplasmata archaeon]
MKVWKEIGEYIRGGKPFGFLVPLLIIFFCAWAWYTRDPKTVAWLREVTWFILGGGAIGSGVMLGRK